MRPSAPSEREAPNTPTRLDLRLAVASAAAWAAAVTAVALPPGPVMIMALTAFAAAGILLAFAPGRHEGLPASLAIAAAAIGLVLASLAAQADLRRPPPLLDAAHAGRYLLLDLVVTTPPSIQQGTGPSSRPEIGFRAVVRRAVIPTTGSRTATIAARSPVTVRLSATPGTPLVQGSRWRVDARLFAHPRAVTVAFTLAPRGSPTLLTAPGAGTGWANPLRDHFLRLAAALPGDGGDLLPGLAIGDTRAVDSTLDAAMKTSSLSHLTAVSGANCAVVVVLVSAVMGACGAGRRLRAGVALAALAGFVILVVPDASITRAAVMALVALACEATGRGRAGLPLLSLAALAMLVGDPWIGRDYGFALSVFATAGLLVLAPPLTGFLARWLPERLARVIAIPAAAQIFCQPILILLAPGIPVYGIAANMLAEMPATAATVTGLLVCVLGGLLPGPVALLAHLAWLPAAWIALVARCAAGLPGATLPWLPGLPGVGAAAAGTLVTVVLVTTPRHRRTLSGVLAAGTGIVLVGAYLGAAGIAVLSGSSRPADWIVAACDVGQGDGIVLHSGNLHAVIDVGPTPQVMTACLHELGIRRIDLLVLTHYDLDHVGGLEAVLGKTTLALIGPARRPGDRQIAERLAAAGTEVRQAGRGDHGMLGALDWDVLWPMRDAAGEDLNSSNEQSVTLEAAVDGVRMIFLADLDKAAQEQILAAGVQGVDIVKVAHHGSADQSPALYRALGARLGIVSVGARNTYGHPTARCLDILREAGTSVVRTDTMGLLLVRRPREGGLAVWSAAAPREAVRPG